MAGDAPEWAADMVRTELRRAYPDAVEKNDLQELVGIGPGDLREALGELIAAGEVRETDVGYEWLEVEDRAGVLTQRSPDPEPDEEEGEPEPAPELRGDVPLATGSSTQYRARLILDVTYMPETSEDAEDVDQAAVDEADQLRVAAMNGVLSEWPDLAVSGAVVSVDAFDHPRRVYGVDAG